MADAIISVVVERVAAIIEDQIRYEVNLMRGVEKKVIDLSNKLETIRNVLDDAEKRGAKEQSVKKWLRKLEDAAYEMDNILDEWKYTLLKHKMEDPAKQKVCCSLIPSSCLSFNKVAYRRDVAKKIQNVKDTLDQILKEKDEFSFVMSLPPTDDSVPKSHPRIQSTSSIEFEKIHGQDIHRNKNAIVRKLRWRHISGDHSQILSIVGMGGIGKTTLAQLVYNDTQVKSCFDLRIWICVSDPFDVVGIARGIVESVTKEIIPPNTNQLDLVMQKLRNCISRKKFLLVLDDVWTEDYNKWEPLKINLKNGAEGSKILVTTRNERVAKMMMRGNVDGEIYRPRKLSDEECWKLLRSISLLGRSEEECGEFGDVGKKIARKCEGLPLAANVLGSLLQFKNSLEEWENILESEIWRLDKAEVELFPHLLLSYNELSPALKRCFSYCAVYPKDSKIRVENLIEEWMAQSYLGSNDIGNAGLELKGQDYFNNLAMRSLFQVTKEKRGWWDEEKIWCKMHDIVHDFAQFLRKNNNEMTMKTCQVCGPLLVSQVQEYRSLTWDKSTPNLCDCFTSLKVLRINKWRLLMRNPPLGMEKLIHLRLLEISRKKLSEEYLKTICRLYFLQTLLLNSCSIQEIPSEIGNLVELRHLDLSMNRKLKELPESMCSLVELQILNIEGCHLIKELPQGIHRLQNLKHILIQNKIFKWGYHLPEGVNRLSSGLRTLGGNNFFAGSGWNKLGWLKNFNRLTGSLKLELHITSNSDVEFLVEDAREAELRNKILIQALGIKFPWPSSSSLWMEVIEALEPNHNLKYLEIYGYVGSRLPRWISSPLNLMKEIHLQLLTELSSLPPMGKLPFLEHLYMDELMRLKFVGREFLGIECPSSSSSSSNDVVVAFHKLKKLEISVCSKWREWEDITVEEEESAAVSIMPCLTQLHIKYCGGLKKLPHRLLRKASSLKILNVSLSSELKRCYGDEDGSPWRSISQYNPKLQLV